MDRPQFTVWITRHAFTDGIFEARAENYSVVSENTIRIMHDDGSSDFFRGREWHRTRQGALARAEAMRVAKIASLKAQIAKMEKLRFE